MARHEATSEIKTLANEIAKGAKRLERPTDKKIRQN